MSPLKPDITQPSKGIIMPFHALLAMLRQNGFFIKPDDYIEMLKVIEKFGSDDIRQAGPLICPLIATSPEQQDKFYKVFDQYISVETEPPSIITKPTPPPHRKWLWIVGGIAVLVLLYFVIIHVFFKQKPLSAGFDQIVKTTRPAEDTAFRVGDTLELDAGISFVGRSFSAENVQLFWNPGNGWKEGTVQQRMVLRKEGPLTIGLKMRSDKIPIKDSIKMITLYVCPAAPQITLSSPEKNRYRKGDSITITAGYNGQPSPFIRTLWYINETDTSKSYNQPVLRYRFDSTGTYQFSFHGVYDDAQSSCDYIQNFGSSISIDEDKSYTLAITPSGKPVLNKPRLNPVINWLFILPALSILLGSFLWWRKKKKKHEEQQKTEPVTFEGARPPYETPFENKDLQLVTRENTFNPVFRSFRQKAEDEVTIFNVPKTIQSTIRAGGLPEFVFTSRLRYNDYLVLIDRTVANGQQARLFDYLVRTLNEEAITVERFYYRNFDKFVNETYHEGLSLQRLSEIYKQYTLIIMGTAHQLVYDAYPVMEKKILETLGEWDYKGILTPVGYKDWGEKENLVKQHINLLPADIKGQLILIQSIREQQRNHEKYLSSIDDFYEAQSYDFESVEDLKAYLDDEILFQWLCALCVFHKLRWEIIIEIGKAICSRYGVPEKMNYTSLLKLVRINWMQEGVFPGITRRELLKELTVENEMTARETLLHLLEFSDTYFGKNHFFEEEKEVQKTTSRFVLFANDPAKYPQFQPEQERFKALWKNDQIRDTPQKAYLDKQPGDKWTTPIEQDGESVGVNDYLDNQWIKERKRLAKSLWRNGGIAFTLLFILACLHLFKNRLPPDTLLPLVYAGDNVRYTFMVKDSMECAGQKGSTGTIQNLAGSLVTGDGSYPLSFLPADNNRLTAQADIPAKQSSTGKGRLEIYWNTGSEENKLESPLALNNTIFDVSVQGCEALPRAPLYIRYNDAASYRAMESQLRNALNRFEISGQQQTFIGSSRLVYYQPDQKPRADSIVQIIRQTFGMNVTTEYIAEQRTPPSVPILFLNIPYTGCTIPLSQDLFDIWYGETNTRTGATAINRLITIDPANKMIWYSTGDESTYGTYRIDEVCLEQNIYRIITKAGDQYQTFLIRNVQPASFELSVCPDRYDTKEEARAVNESVCSGFYTMRPYYEKDNAKIFLALNPNKPEASSQAKIKRLNDNVNRLRKDGAAVTVTGALYYNAKFRWQSSRGLPYPAAQNIPLPSPTPFDRNYVQYKVTTTSKEPSTPNVPAKDSVPDCSRIFKSIAEARRVKPLVVCWLDLSNKNLKEIPKEVSSFKNLRRLDLRNNYISETDLQRFQKELPNCKVAFEPQKKTETTDNRTYSLFTVEFDDKDYPLENANGFIRRLGALLRGYPDYKVSLYVYYSKSTIGLVRARARARVLSDLLQKSGAGSGQILTSFNQLPDPQPQQQQGQLNSVSDQLRDKIVINGIGFKEVPSAGYEKNAAY